MTKMKISIVIPAYNEEARIGKTLEAYAKFFNSLAKAKGFSYRILVVINGTTDKTEEIVKCCQKKFESINYLNFKRAGKGFAITEGFKDSIKKDFNIIGFVDADLATYPEEYLKLISSIDNFDGAIANRYAKNSKIIPAFSFRRILVSRVFNFLVRVLFHLPYEDTQCGAKVFKKDAIKKILNNITMTQWAYDIDLLYICKTNNLKIKSVPTIWLEKEGTKLNIIKSSIQMLFAIIQLRILKSPFKKSLRILSPIIGIIYKLVRGI